VEYNWQFFSYSSIFDNSLDLKRIEQNWKELSEQMKRIEKNCKELEEIVRTNGKN